MQELQRRSAWNGPFNENWIALSPHSPTLHTKACRVSEGWMSERMHPTHQSSRHWRRKYKWCQMWLQSILFIFSKNHRDPSRIIKHTYEESNKTRRENPQLGMNQLRSPSSWSDTLWTSRLDGILAKRDSLPRQQPVNFTKISSVRAIKIYLRTVEQTYNDRRDPER